MIMQSLASPLAGIAEAVTGGSRPLASSGGQTVAMTGNACPRFKLAQVIDQAKDIEMAVLDVETLLGFRKHYVLAFGDNPMDNAEVTDAQIRALHHLVSSGLPPYADFGVRGLNGTRAERHVKFKTRCSWLLESARSPRARLH